MAGPAALETPAGRPPPALPLTAATPAFVPGRLLVYAAAGWWSTKLPRAVAGGAGVGVAFVLRGSQVSRSWHGQEAGQRAGSLPRPPRCLSLSSRPGHSCTATSAAPGTLFPGGSLCRQAGAGGGRGEALCDGLRPAAAVLLWLAELPPPPPCQGWPGSDSRNLIVCKSLWIDLILTSLTEKV